MSSNKNKQAKQNTIVKIYIVILIIIAYQIDFVREGVLMLTLRLYHTIIGFSHINPALWEWVTQMLGSLFQ